MHSQCISCKIEGVIVFGCIQCFIPRLVKKQDSGLHVVPHRLLSGLLVFSADSPSFSMQTVGLERDRTIADGEIRDDDDVLGPGVRADGLGKEVGRLPLACGSCGVISRSL